MDLILRLRTFSAQRKGAFDGNEASDIAWEAAGEIERLRDENQIMQETLDAYGMAHAIHQPSTDSTPFSEREGSPC